MRRFSQKNETIFFGNGVHLNYGWADGSGRGSGWGYGYGGHGSGVGIDYDISGKQENLRNVRHSYPTLLVQYWKDKI